MSYSKTMIYGLLMIKTVLLISICMQACCQDVCEVCSCRPSPVLPELVVCENGNLTSLPANLSSLTRLLIINEKVEKILAADLQGLIELTKFEIIDNNLSVIEPGAFNNLNNLQELVLSNNTLSQITEYVLTGLGNLTHLAIDNNMLGALPDSICNMLTSIEYFNAEGNKMQSIGPNVFTGCGSVAHIDISNNQITYIGEGAFMNLDSLSTLLISGNRLTTFYSAWLVNKSSSLNLAMDKSGWHCTAYLKMEYQKMNESHPSIIGCNSNESFCPLCANFGGRRLEDVTMEELVVTTTVDPTIENEMVNSTNGNIVTSDTFMSTTSSAEGHIGNKSLMVALLAAILAGTIHQ